MTECDGSAGGRTNVPSKTLLMAVWAAGIGGSFQYGYNLSIINAPTKDVQLFINQTWMQRYNTQISANLLTLLWSSIVSVFTIGGLVGALVGASLAVRYGRKGTLLINNAFAVLAAVLMGLSSLTSAFELLIAGRFICGINAGVGICVQPLYLGEIAPRALRGAMAMGTSLFLTGGILTGQVMGLTELLGGDYWPLLFVSPCVPAVLQLVFLPQCPESPRYLLIDRAEEAACTAALRWLHGAEHFQVEMEDMQRERISAEAKKPWQVFTERGTRWPIFISIIICTAQQLSGINAIYFYAEYVFSEARIPAKNIPYVTVGTGACECITALTCTLLIERLGRRALIIGGYSLMSLWCVCFTLTLSFQKSSSWVPYLSMICIFAFILSFGLGPGGVTNILITELFTQTTRPAAYMIAGSVNWLSFFFISMLFPFIVNGLQQFCFLVFLVICCFVAVFIFFFVPETKNKTFLEIQSELCRERRKASQVSNGVDTPQVSTSL
ncbi:solute carrier family 2, facilitated glucose transporter member 11b [Clarias gariepinus]|uniref:solute carrier family 2, facilitated glucose transporter member 11b n=1 Tax=Clarias gariepinus TaxID=13013 RepID=UPI00234E290B|nr:solute carrier family 2, facilitated glucose transporter member 11b [Clarias gariepinus]